MAKDHRDGKAKVRIFYAEVEGGESGIRPSRGGQQLDGMVGPLDRHLRIGKRFGDIGVVALRSFRLGRGGGAFEGGGEAVPVRPGWLVGYHGQGEGRSRHDIFS